MTSTTVWRAVADALVAEGAERVFGLPGNPKHLLFDLTEHTNIAFYLGPSQEVCGRLCLCACTADAAPGHRLLQPRPRHHYAGHRPLGGHVGLASGDCDLQRRGPGA